MRLSRRVERERQRFTLATTERKRLHAVRDLRSAFSAVTAYVAAVPTYVGGHMALGFASEDPALARPDPDVLQARFERAGVETRYYTPAVHRAAFALPRFIGDAVEEGLALVA